MLKQLKYFVNYIPINSYCYPAEYPWGWVPHNIKKNLIIPQNTISENNINNNITINKYKFKKTTTYCYKIIYNTYLENEDFLDYNYTCPSLSIALNSLRKECIINNLDNYIDVKKVSILGSWLENGIIKNNNIFNKENKNIITNDIIAGMIGPEFKTIWDNVNIKQKVRVLYISEQYYDIVDWERNINVKNPQWQVYNINGILY